MKKIFFVTLLAFQVSCTSIVMFPSREVYSDPLRMGYEYEKQTIMSEDGTKLRAWYFKSKKGPAKALILNYHGNAENITSHYQGLVWMTDQGFDYLIMDYRGYGESEKEKDMEGAQKDARASLKYAVELSKQKKLPLIIYAHSLGGNFALKALEEVGKPSNLKLIVIESSFLSYTKIGREKLALTWISWPFQWLAYLLLTDKYSPTEKGLKALAPTPVITIYSTQDPVVPGHHTQEIYDKLDEPKELWVHPYPGHTNSMFVDNGSYRKKLINYIDSLRN